MIVMVRSALPASNWLLLGLARLAKLGPSLLQSHSTARKARLASGTNPAAAAGPVPCLRLTTDLTFSGQPASYVVMVIAALRIAMGRTSELAAANYATFAPALINIRATGICKLICIEFFTKLPASLMPIGGLKLTAPKAPRGGRILGRAN